MATSRDGSKVLKDALVRKLRTEFDISRVPGISGLPLIIQRVTNNTPEPYIYIRVEDTDETYVTKDNSSREYNLVAEVMVKSSQNSGNTDTRDAIVSELTNVLDAGVETYPDLDNDGYNLFLLNVGSGTPTVSEERGATYFKSSVRIQAQMEFVGLPSTNQPVQAPAFTYGSFLLQPTANAIEEGDGGTITTALTYNSNNFGWDYVNGTVIQPFGSDGALAGNVYTISNTDANIQLGVTLNYEFGDDDSITTSLMSTHQWLRTRSVRYGTVEAQGGSLPTLTNNMDATYGLNLLSNWVSPTQSVDIGNVSPVGEQITIQGQIGEHIYIIFDSSEDNLTAIRQDLFDTDITNRFQPVQTIGNFKIYISTDALNYTGDITLDLS